MRKNFGAKPWTYPQPVFILAAYGEDGTPNAMNAAWGGICDDKELSMCISTGHKTTANIRARGAFTLSFADAEHVVAADYVGLVSANREPRKLEKSGFHTSRSRHVDAPLIDELPVALECKLIKVNEDGNIIGQIVNVSVDEAVLAGDGGIDFDKFRPIAFEPARNGYHVLGERVGSAFRDGAALD